MTGMVRRFAIRVSMAAVAALLGGAAHPQTPAQSPPGRVELDAYSFKIDGKRVYIWSGEFHPYRLPSPDLWRDILQKMKAAGFNTVSVYFSWSYHSPEPGVYDFSGVRDMDRMLDIAAEEGIYVIARPGPYINAEVDSGGFPLWLTRYKVDNRTDDPAYLAFVDEWLARIDAVIARHQWTEGKGTVIAYQIENEYYRADRAGGREYVEHLKQQAVAHGITVPLIGNHNANFVAGKGSLAVDGWDYYPQGFDCSNPEKWRPAPDMAQRRVPDQLLFTPEFQGGAFDPWGGPGYAKCAALINDRFANVFYKQNIAAGATAQNFYMIYGGTSWGWQAIPQNYTSYDYGAAITEARQFDPKYDENKRIGYFTQAVAPLTKTIGIAPAKTDNPLVVDVARRNPETHTQFHYFRHADSTATTTSSFHFDLTIGGRAYDAIPRAPGTALTLNGRQGKMLLANYTLGATTLVYSTSELMTNATVGDRDIALLYGDSGQPGETVLRFASRPEIQVLEGAVEQSWADGDLRLNYIHGQPIRVLVSGGGTARPLLLIAGDRQEGARFWRMDTAAGPVLVRGTHLLRSAKRENGRLDLTGDVGEDGRIEVFAADAPVRWNGKILTGRRSLSGSFVGRLPTARPVSLPRLSWRMREEGPEINAAFDDSGWQVADKTETVSITKPGTMPVLFADDYGFHTGNIWYRGRFRVDAGAAPPTGLSLIAMSGGRAGAASVWLNGQFLGSVEGEKLERSFTFPPNAIIAGADNVLSVLTVNMGHEQDYHNRNENRTARGLVAAALEGGAGGAIHWRIQGAPRGKRADTLRGPLNNGGLYGERVGWFLAASAPGRDWHAVSLPHRGTPGIRWYRSEVRLDLPREQDTSVGLEITDEPGAHYRATIFVNGWHMGNYVAQLGPQRRFPIPNGVLNAHGPNRIAIAVWNTRQTGGGLGRVSLVNLGSYLSPLRVGSVAEDAKRLRAVK